MIEMLLRQLEGIVLSVTVTTIKYGDIDYGELPVLITDRGTPAQAIADVQHLAPAGGGDDLEPHLHEIENALRTIVWPDNPAKERGAMVTFTTADTKPNRSGLTARQLGAEIHQRGILYYHVGEPTPTLQELVDGAHGMMLPISNEPDRAAIERIAAALAASITGSVQNNRTEPMPVFA